MIDVEAPKHWLASSMMDTYAALLANGPAFDWYRNDDSISRIRDLFLKLDFEVWAGRYFTGNRWK